MAGSVGLLLAWTLFAFGGVYIWAAIPFAVGAGGLAVAVRPPILRGDVRALDLALLGVLAAITTQLIPLPAAVVELVSPATLRASAALRLAPGGSARSFLPLSLDASATIHALGVTAAAVLLFWVCRATFEVGGIRTVTRSVAMLGVGASALALVQAATSHGLIYWSWRPYDESAEPFGPFVNRNFFGTWVLMAIPLCLGYLAARADAPGRRSKSLAARIVRVTDDRTLWLLAALASMTLALVVSLSRSAIAGLTLGLAMGWGFVHRRLDRRRRRWLAVGLTAAAGAAMLWADLPALGARIRHVGPGLTDRATIWRETLPVVRDFWTAGTGAGTYEQAMLVYQQSDRTVYFNQAHDHYLQAAAEGGALVGFPLVAAFVSLVGLGRRRLAGDRTGMYWMRAGAATGLAALAIQSIWETGLSLPANASLAAVLAAVLVHLPQASTRPPGA